MSSRNSGRFASKPPSWFHTSRRTSMPAELTASTARLPSCWPWSISPGSTPVSRRPARSVVMPASRTTRRSDRSFSFGPRTADDRLRPAPASSCSSASGAGSQSSCSSQTHSVPSTGPARRATRWAARCPGRAGRGVLQGAGDGGAVPGVRLHAEDRVLAEQLGQGRPAAIPAAGVHPDQALHRMSLLAHRFDESRQQPRRVMGDDHDGNDVTEVPGVLRPSVLGRRALRHWALGRRVLGRWIR